MQRLTVRSDDRAVSPVIGAILVFGLVVAVIALIQVNAIPLEVQQTEFEHNQLAQEQLLALGEDIEDSATIGTVNAETVVLGTRYTAGFPFVSPGPAAGELRTESATVEFTNVRALDPEVDDYWNGTDRVFATNRILYEPGYNQYRNAPVTVIGPEGTHNRFARERAVIGLDGGLVNGNTVTLVTVEGSLSGSRVGPKSVQTYPVATPMRTTRVTSPDPATPIRIAITTSADPERIRTLYADEPNVTAVESTADGDGVELVLAPGTYRLRLGKASLDSPGTDEPAAYLTNESDVRGSLRAGETQTVAFRVWSGHNTPVADEPVTLALTGPAVFDGPGVPEGTTALETTAGRDGRVEATVRTTGVGEVGVVASVGGVTDPAANVDSPAVASDTLTVLDGAGGEMTGETDGVSQINPSPGETIWLDTVTQTGTQPAGLTFENDLASGFTLTAARVSFFFDSSSGTQAPTAAIISFENASESLPIGGRFQDVTSLQFALDREGQSNDSRTLSLELEGANFGQGDFLVLSTRWRSTAPTDDREFLISYFVAVN